ncbi:zinc finger protein 2-like [Hyposmocoma kahamanoa]|uniref:zinc finger protein 2-like n=1 Tax=Hyposmocoma kahamanoa TaxID=1477025 RepID=UPI000E6D6E81|nr:zinc finger protein 2-like [Hyposmocoma kahamanoa]
MAGFDDDELFLLHNRKWHREDKNPCICALCNAYLKSKKQLSRHIQQHNNSYKCILCDHICMEKDRQSHLEQQHIKLLQCLTCDLLFKCRKDFFAHFKEWHEKFTCDHCGITFKMRYCIKNHIRKQHSPFECKQCKKRFARYNGLWLHNKTTHSTSVQPAYCVECDKEYPDVYRYRWHLANSTRHKPRKKVRIPCQGCDKVFSKNIYMKDHFNLVHLKIYKYRCEECDKNFIRNADLVKHHRRIHERIPVPKNKICYMCGRGFSTNKILTNHLRTHTGERPHACTHCGARFAQSTALLGHIRALHNRTQAET